MHVAIIGYADRFADRDIGLRRDRGGVDDKRFALPVPDRMAVQRQIRVLGMRTAIRIDSPHPVAVDFAQHGDAAGGHQKFKRVVRDQHPAWHAVRQTIVEHQERPAGLFLVNHVLDLRQDIRLPGRHVRRFLPLLVSDVRKPYAA